MNSPPTRRVHRVGRVGLAVHGDQRLGVALGVVLRLVAERAGGGEVPPVAGVRRDAPDDGEAGRGRPQRGVDQPTPCRRGRARWTAAGSSSARGRRCRSAGRRRPGRSGRRRASPAPPSSPWRRRSRCPAAAGRRPRAAARRRAAGCTRSRGCCWPARPGRRRPAARPRARSRCPRCWCARSPARSTRRRCPRGARPPTRPAAASVIAARSVMSATRCSSPGRGSGTGTTSRLRTAQPASGSPPRRTGADEPGRAGHQHRTGSCGQPPDEPTRNSPSRPAASLPAAMTSSASSFSPVTPGRRVGDQREPEDLQALGVGRDRLERRRHAHQVRAHRAQHPDLGRRLVVRAGQRGVDALGQLRVQRAGELAQPRGVEVGEVDEVRRRPAGSGP